MQVDSCALLLFLFRKLKWMFPLIFIHYIVNFYVLKCFSRHSPHPHPSSQLIHFPISKQITAVCDCDKFTSIYVLLKLSLISVVIWLALLRIMLILLNCFVTFNTNLCQLRTTITYDMSFIPPSLPLLLCNTDDIIAILLLNSLTKDNFGRLNLLEAHNSLLTMISYPYVKQIKWYYWTTD